MKQQLQNLEVLEGAEVGIFLVAQLLEELEMLVDIHQLKVIKVEIMHTLED